MTTETLEARIERHFAAGSAAAGDPDSLAAFLELRAGLEAGTLRSAEPDAASPTGWRVNAWVKRGILLGFRLGTLTQMNGVHPDGGSILSFVDKATYPARRFAAEDGVRIVPGGSSVRSGAFVSRGVVIMPPAYINAGAYVDEGTMVDSHALVGSCAQIGKRVHLSAAAQIGGVLEPVNASPVIIEDDVLVGGNTGVYEGTIVRKRAVLAAGTILTRGTPVYDVVNDTVLRATRRQATDHPGGRGRRSRLARRHQRLRQADGPQRLHPCHRQVSRRKDRPLDHARRRIAINVRYIRTRASCCRGEK